MSNFYILRSKESNKDGEYLPLAGGIMSGDLNMANYSVKNVPTPTLVQEVTSKGYVDNLLLGVLDLAGNRQMTGDLDMGDNSIVGIHDITASNSVVSKNYVDTKARGKVSLAGDTMSGILYMDGNRIKTLGTPSSSTDATNKSYVDGKFLPLAGGTMTGTLNARQLTCTGFNSNDSVAYRQFYIGNPKNKISGWFLGNQFQSPTNSDNDLYFMVRYPNGNIVTAGFIADGSANVKMNFTGQHRCKCDTPMSDLIPGMILECTGKFLNMFGPKGLRDVPTINDAIPIVRMCNAIGSKKVFGVFSGIEDIEKREYNSGNFISVYTKSKDDNRIFVNSLGEGSILVCDNNGSFSNGDYIESSKHGYGQRQESSNLKNTTVAKITQDEDFSSSTTPPIDINGKMCRTSFVGCTYHCG